MNWKRIALYINVGKSFVDIGYEALYTVIIGMLNQTPYAGESYVSSGLRVRGIFVQSYRVREILSTINSVSGALRWRAVLQRRL